MHSYYPLYTRGTFSKASGGITCCADVSSMHPTIETKWKLTLAPWNIFHRPLFWVSCSESIVSLLKVKKNIYICVYIISVYIIVLFQTPGTVYSLHSLCFHYYETTSCKAIHSPLRTKELVKYNNMMLGPSRIAKWRQLDNELFYRPYCV